MRNLQDFPQDVVPNQRGWRPVLFRRLELLNNPRLTRPADEACEVIPGLRPTACVRKAGEAGVAASSSAVFILDQALLTWLWSV